jgi:Isochorismatase family
MARFTTPLETILRNLERDTIIIVGTLTNFCCGMTARQGYERGFNVVFGSDLTATDDPDLDDGLLDDRGPRCRTAVRAVVAACLVAAIAFCLNLVRSLAAIWQSRTCVVAVVRTGIRFGPRDRRARFLRYVKVEK